ncbi:hypothetical protein ACJX0J_025967, partial [Zea mays]
PKIIQKKIEALFFQEKPKLLIHRLDTNAQIFLIHRLDTGPHFLTYTCLLKISSIFWICAFKKYCHIKGDKPKLSDSSPILVMNAKGFTSLNGVLHMYYIGIGGSSDTFLYFDNLTDEKNTHVWINIILYKLFIGNGLGSFFPNHLNEVFYKIFTTFAKLYHLFYLEAI